MKKISTTLKALVAILNDGESHSGNALGEQLGISRNAVWKHINQLSKFGVVIDSLQSKGYRLSSPLSLLDSQAIKKQLSLSQRKKISQLDIFASIPSTNDYLREQPISKDWHFCLAEHQSAGKGRLGHIWHSPFAANLYLSCRWLSPKDVSQLSGLSLVVSLAIVEMLTAHGVQDLQIKWPNDIIWRDQKLAGILIEMDIESHGAARVVIGIGLNVNMTESAGKAIDRAWISLDRILGHIQDRSLLAGKLIQQLIHYLDVFSQADFADFLPQWSRYDYLANKPIQLNYGNNRITGIAMGVNAAGHLLLKKEDSTIQTVTAGEASIIR